MATYNAYNAGCRKKTQTKALHKKALNNTKQWILKSCVCQNLSATTVDIKGQDGPICKTEEL